MNVRTIFVLIPFFAAVPGLAQSIQATDASSATASLIKIPIDAKRWYQLNNVNRGLDQLFDGNLYERPNTGYGKVLQNYDSYYPILDGEKITISEIRFFDWEGVMTQYPVTLWVITDTWQRKKIATFTGEQYNTWAGPYPARAAVFTLDAKVTNIKYLVLNAWYEYPTEIEFYGTYKAPAKIAAAVKKPVKLKDFLGVNAFEWDFMDGAQPMVIEETRMKAVKTFSQIRHYMDWEKLESVEGSYTYSPVHSGGWNYDTMYARCKAEGIEVLACLKTIPGWLQATYPTDQRDAENAPVRYGKNLEDPNSYIEQAKLGFQYIARYGNNKNVKTSVLKVNTAQRWTGDDINKIRVGLGYIKYIECDNERDKWWKGRKAYQNGREYAANLSAFYDGHKKTMGQGVGVKNADSDVLVVMTGTASYNTDYLRGMIDWCKEFRGYKADGTVNFCWDIINYHLYSSNASLTADGNPTRGMAPEVSNAAAVANNFFQAAHQYANDMPVWITETGYDDNQTSPYKAIPIGSRSADLTKADWCLRTALLYARSGVQKCFFYELYDDMPGSGYAYGTSGFIKPNRARKPAGDFIFQTKKLFGKYVYKETLKQDPIVDRYELNSASMYVLVVPGETGRTATYTLNLGTATSANICTPKAGSDNMDVKTVKVTNGKLKITVTETPVFVVPVTAPSFSYGNTGILPAAHNVVN